MADSPREIFGAAALQDLLTGLCGSPVAVDRWQSLEPWSVARVWLRGASELPCSVVVKRVSDGERDARTAAWRLRTELAALRFLSEDRGTALGPRVVAADPAAGFLVLEDLAPRVPLDQLLRRDGAAAHGERLAAFARARGALSAATAGQAEAYYARRAALGPVDAATDRAGRLAPLRKQAIQDASALGVPASSQAEHELATAMAELTDPGPFLALSNGDAEANNVLLHASGPPDARLIDFEFAGYTHALTDAVCLHVPGPAWLAVGDPAAAGLADQYRSALAHGIPEAEDDRRYGDGLAAACVSWALVRLQRFARLDTRPPGDHSRLQLVATLEATAHTAETHRALPHVTGWIHRTATALRHRWPDANQDLADSGRFPPYRPRG
ncbi:phosphotransferase [Streptomyces odontomachi]|uniref:phosphotransferase n=1 Tax=Streptomyces odontomachi TaxID=2944940 RepID=UPI00210860FC|nr:phosphotransferase [Streptomyces sp. ODS25]